MFQHNILIFDREIFVKRRNSRNVRSRSVFCVSDCLDCIIPLERVAYSLGWKINDINRQILRAIVYSSKTIGLFGLISPNIGVIVERIRHHNLVSQHILELPGLIFRELRKL